MMRAPDAVASAHGRVNLLGEHTDYNDGFVLPTAIPQQTTVTLHRTGGAGFTVTAAALGETDTFTLDHAPTRAFAAYVYGCVREVAQLGVAVPGLQIDIASDVPIGVGLSSSAALEIAMLRALRALLGFASDDASLAVLGQRIEMAYAGVRCGIMDQMAASLASVEKMLFLDTRTLETRVLPVPADTELLVLDSGTARTLAGSGYNTRRAECEQAAALLGVFALRDVEDLRLAAQLPAPLDRRVRHVVTENARVLQAIQTRDAAVFGALMNDSHASLRDDYEVSVPALDTLVALLQAHPDVHGARLTGAGFGGACVALCRAGRADAVARDVLPRYESRGFNGRVLVPPP